METRGHRAQCLTGKIVDFVTGEREGARSGEGGSRGEDNKCSMGKGSTALRRLIC